MTITATPTTTRTQWTVDAGESAVEFSVKTFWGLGTVRGRFDRFDGWYDGQSIALTIEADSLSTGNATRDKHLRSDGFFHIVEHPRVRFHSTRVHDVDGEILHVDGEILHVVGRLEAAGKAVTLEFPATVRPIGDELEIEATTTLDQGELGMSSGTLGMIRTPVTLHVRARLSRP